MSAFATPTAISVLARHQNSAFVQSVCQRRSTALSRKTQHELLRFPAPSRETVTSSQAQGDGVETKQPVIDNPTQLASGFAKRVNIRGRELSYDFIEGNNGPTLVFLPGYFFSRWKQAKANALEIFAKRKGQAILVEEYLGTGKSSGDFAKDGTLSQWISDTCSLIDRVPGKVLLVGAGVGGWIMLHVALQRANRVVGLVGINPSVDFTHDLIIPSMTSEQMDSLENAGVVNIPWGYCNYPISKALLDDAEKWQVLKGGKNSLDIKCPVRFLQGLSDEEIPPDRILTLVDTVRSEDCVLSFIKYGDHFLEDEADMRRMWEAVCDVSDSFYEYDLTSPWQRMIFCTIQASRDVSL